LELLNLLIVFLKGQIVNHDLADGDALAIMHNSNQSEKIENNLLVFDVEAVVGFVFLVR